MFSDIERTEVRCAFERSLFTMKENKLLTYISMLTPEQIEKLVNQLPRLISSLSEQAQPCRQEQTSQNQ